MKLNIQTLLIGLCLGVSTILIVKAFLVKGEAYRQNPDEEVRF